MDARSLPKCARMGAVDSVRAARQRALFALFAARTRRTLGHMGATLEIDAPHGVELASLPHLELTDWGKEGDARLTLRIGSNVRFGRDVVFEVYPGATSVVEIGDDSELGDMTRVQLRGGALRLGPRTRVRSFVVLKCDGEIVTGGDNEISYGAIFHSAERIALGERTGIAERVSIVDSDHVADGTDTHFYNTPLRRGPVVIEDNVFVAAGAVLTRGTHIQRNSVVGAGAVITGAPEFPPGSLIAGAPARVVRQLQPETSSR
jgi:carbonic anhydrase/acetyltransferase-like protein (isoleucine patch superfamily)